MVSQLLLLHRVKLLPRLQEKPRLRLQEERSHHHHLAERIIAVPSRTTHALVPKWTHTLWERRRRDRARSCPGWARGRLEDDYRRVHYIAA